MLESLIVQNIALIDRLTVDFHPGLLALTGETGAGKSIVIDAITLLLGGRASRDLIRSGADRAFAEGVFSLADCPFSSSTTSFSGNPCTLPELSGTAYAVTFMQKMSTAAKTTNINLSTRFITQQHSFSIYVSMYFYSDYDLSDHVTLLPLTVASYTAQSCALTAVVLAVSSVTCADSTVTLRL